MNKDASSFKFNVYSYCPVMNVMCSTLNTLCFHWQGTYCDAENMKESYLRWYEEAFYEE